MLSGRKEQKMRRMIREFWENEDGMGVVEVVLITIDNSLPSITYV